MEKILNDEGISWKAKGIYAYISQQGSEELSAEVIVDKGTDGRYAVMEALIELEDAGFLRREKQQGGKMKYLTT